MANKISEEPTTVPSEEFEQIANSVARSTQTVLRSKPSSSNISTLLEDVHSLVDEKITKYQLLSTVKVDCKPGCCWCCHEIVLATPPEILAIFEFLQTNFSPEEKFALRERLREYDERMAPLRSKPFTLARQRCPFLVDSLCSIYSGRPIACRGKSSIDVDACRMWKESPGEGENVPFLVAQQVVGLAAERGISFGFSGKGDTRHELGLAIKLLFEDPTRVDRVTAGAYQFPTPVPKPPARRFPADPTSISPIGHPPESPIGEAVRNIQYSHPVDFTPLFADNPTAAMFLKLRPPLMYSSFEQIEEFRSQMDEALDQLHNSQIDLREALMALVEQTQPTMPYQGLPVRSLLEKQGRFILDRIVSLVYPKLCAPIEGRRRPGRFRLGYVSGSLTNTNSSKWALGWLRNHSSEMETFAFNLGFEDVGSKLWADAATHYYRLEGNLQRIAEFIRSKELDALIITDVGIYPRDFIYFSMRLARVQCTAWGVPTTSGLPNIDYYLSADLMEPEGAEAEYSEKLVRLPRTGLCYPRPKTSFWDSEFTGKSKEFFPFMAQNIRKWTPQRDPLLKRIADRYGKPLKFLSLPDPELTSAFSERMTKAGIQHEMLPLAYQKGYANYLRSAHVSFDPPDWSGGNTTIEALSYGVPVVTLPGPYMRGRHSYAFLKVANAEGLIAEDEDDFVDLIFDPERQRQAMSDLNLDALYEDTGVVEALDAFLLNTSKAL